MLVPVAGVVRASTGEQREAVRTRIVLLTVTSSIAATLGMVPQMVSTGREASLPDKPRSGP